MIPITYIIAYTIAVFTIGVYIIKAMQIKNDTRIEGINSELTVVWNKMDSLDNKLNDTTRHDAILDAIKELGEKVTDTKLTQAEFVKRDVFQQKIDEINCKIVGTKR